MSGLMVLAWESGWDANDVWALNEHSLPGMEPQLDRDRVLGEIRERAEARKQGKVEGRGQGNSPAERAA